MADHVSRLEPTPDDLPEPMKRITCSCGTWKAIGLSTRECNALFDAHVESTKPKAHNDQ